MARVKSILSVRGRIGDTVFVRRNGITIAGMSGGASRDKILTAPEFINTRKNMAEFGACASMAKSVYDNLSTPIFATVRKKTSMRQMIAELRKIQQAYAGGTELNGERTVKLHEDLINFQFNEKNKFKSIYGGAFDSEISVGADSATITFEDVNPQSDMVIPAGATHFKLIAGIVGMSQSKYNAVSGAYDKPVIYGKAIQESAFLEVSGTIVIPALITLMPGAPVIPPDGTSILTLGISFYKEVGGVKNKMFENDAMECVDTLTIV